MVAIRPDTSSPHGRVAAPSSTPLTSSRHRTPASSFTPHAGDVVFGNRLSWTQVCKNVTADQWTHVAVVAPICGELRAVELGPKGCATRSLADFEAAYRYVGYARPPASPACTRHMVDWAVQRVGVDFNYSWTHFAVAGCASVARRFGPSGVQEAVTRASRRAAGFTDRHLPGASVCSSFVWDYLGQGCEACRPVLRWPARDRVPPWRARPTVTDVSDRRDDEEPSVTDREARLLANPSDIWVAMGYAVRVVVDGDRATALYDHTGEGVRRPCTRRPHLSVVPPPEPPTATSASWRPSTEDRAEFVPA